MTPTHGKSVSDRQSANNSARIGEIVRMRRKESGMTQIEAAAMCGVGTRFLSDLENGKSTLHLGKVLQVLKGLGLSVLIKRKEFADERDA